MTSVIPARTLSRHDGGMSTAPGDPSTQRVSDAERQSAIAQLKTHWEAGRLDPTEHEARTTKAYAAVTRRDLGALFADLPALPVDGGSPHEQGLAAAPGSPGTPMPSTGSPARAPTGERDVAEQRSWLDGKREAIMGVTPFVALVLFFVTHQWLFFLLIPAMGAVLYADGGGDSGSKRRRRLERDERRRLGRGE